MKPRIDPFLIYDLNHTSSKLLLLLIALDQDGSYFLLILIKIIYLQFYKKIGSLLLYHLKTLVYFVNLVRRMGSFLVFLDLKSSFLSFVRLDFDFFFQ